MVFRLIRMFDGVHHPKLTNLLQFRRRGFILLRPGGVGDEKSHSEEHGTRWQHRMTSGRTSTNMTPAALERYLRDHIPLSKAMDVKVASANLDEVVLRAPLAPNINHRDTVFGGSASALAILAAWSLLHMRMRDADLEGNLVLQRNSVEYDKPIAGDFTARSSLTNPGDWLKFARALDRKGKARLTVESVLECAGKVAGRFSGEFVALSKQSQYRAGHAAR